VQLPTQTCATLVPLRVADGHDGVRGFAGGRPAARASRGQWSCPRRRSRPGRRPAAAMDSGAPLCLQIAQRLPHSLGKTDVVAPSSAPMLADGAAFRDGEASDAGAIVLEDAPHAALTGQASPAFQDDVLALPPEPCRSA